MNKELLKQLSEADAIASQENSVRQILRQQINPYASEELNDKIGSSIFRHKKSHGKTKIMFAAHMDEVGFTVRNISEIGMVYVMNVGGVQDAAKSCQRVRITTESGRVIQGQMNVTFKSDGKVNETYIDVGCDSKAEVEDLGIQCGDMVCFVSEMMQINEHRYIGKAMDDRIGCYIISEVARRLENVELNCEVFLAGTSSEEVGVRGGKLATYVVQPDVFFAIDVANAPDLVRDHNNQRKLGQGLMVVHYDKMLAPNRKMLRWIKDLAATNHIDYQSDMFAGGGTDAGNASLSRDGTLSMVLGIPLRQCHSPQSIVDDRDVESCINLCVLICQSMTEGLYKDFCQF